MVKCEHQDVRRIFDLIVDLPGPARTDALARECHGDPELERRALAMLAAVEGELPPTTTPASADGDGSGTPIGHEEPGSCVGPYKLLERIGEGGFGVVFVAEQEQPVRRTVALKVIKLGMDTRQVVARFEQERQALALMDHPNIAKVLDAGATDSGRPYFVMELVRGNPITEYCDRHALSLRERLELFIQVCHALHHAHQKGIIHRDIKPSNVLVALQDDVAVPKVIDFGIAKATSGRLTDKTVFTGQQQLIGTPAYMSPEQAERSGHDVDTRTDVYSLGVLLYELLTGTTPFDVPRLLHSDVGEFQRVLREIDPPKPSTRVGALGDHLARVAARRGSAPPKLGAALRGDLDWIVMKTLEKDRARRYESAHALAVDVRNHLDGAPVVAAPPSAIYRFRKFVRRRRGLVAALGAIAAMFLLAIAGTSVGFVEARASAKAERAARDIATTQRERAERTAGFLRDMLASVDPETAGGREITVREILDSAAAKVGSSLGGEPEVEASLRATLGESYHQLGRHREAKEQYLREHELRTRLLGPDDRATLAARYGLGVAMLLSGEVAPAREHLSATLAAQARGLGARDADTLQTSSMYGHAQQLAGEDEAALRTYQEVLAGQRDVLGKTARATLETRASIADVLQELGRLDEARAAAEELVADARAAEGPEGPRTLQGESILVSILTDLGRYSDAEPVGRDVLAAKLRLYGEEHQSTIVTSNTVALVLEHLDRFDEAVALLTRASEASARALGPEHDTTLTLLGNLARNQQLRGRLDEAETAFRRVLETRRRVSGDDATATLAVMNNLGLLLLARQKPADAEPLLREMAQGVERTLPPDHWIRGQALVNLARSLADQAKCEEAEELMVRGYEQLARVLPAGHDRLKNASAAVVEMYSKCHDAERAAQWKAAHGNGGTR